MNVTNENLNFSLDCYIPQDFHDSADFFKCSNFFSNQKLGVLIVFSFLIVGIVIANGFVLLMLLRLKSKMQVFNQIIVGHCIVLVLLSLILFFVIYIENVLIA